MIRRLLPSPLLTKSSSRNSALGSAPKLWMCDTPAAFFARSRRLYARLRYPDMNALSRRKAVRSSVKWCKPCAASTKRAAKLPTSFR